jgi:L-seryl-tRNA(Ser) seleniumtransferase
MENLLNVPLITRSVMATLKTSFIESSQKGTHFVDGTPTSLRSLPAVHRVLGDDRVGPLIERYGVAMVTDWVRQTLQQLRDDLRQAESPSKVEDNDIGDRVVATVVERAAAQAATRMGRVINATGVVLHTGLGRAPLSTKAREAIADAAGACNVEVDLESGERSWRGVQLLEAWRTLTGCEDALVVNNNAAATLLVLQSLCAGREVVLSRGQMIEIGGSFRLPEIFAQSGAKLREIGTTNRTHLADYERAIGPETAALFRVHPSNYRVIGFTEAPEIGPLVRLAQCRNVIAIDDIGSGCLVDMTRFGLSAEPTFPESLAAGADLVLGSGDKLLGGPQCGIILGRASLIERIRRHPLTRAVRIDKLTLAALGATLDSYLRGTQVEEIPTLAMLATSIESLRQRATRLAQRIGTDALKATVRDGMSPVGGGSLPGAELPTALVALRHERLSCDSLARQLRCSRLFPRIVDGEVCLDLRSVPADEDEEVARIIQHAGG